MRLLLDTHIVLAMLGERLDSYPPKLVDLIRSPDNQLFVSVASLWEIAIKTRLGKLRLAFDIALLPELVEQIDIRLVPIIAPHVVTSVVPLPSTRDPFDRLLLAQCHVEDLRLVTVDRALVDHPLATSTI